MVPTSALWPCVASPGGGGQAGMGRVMALVKCLDSQSVAGGIWLFFMESIGGKTGTFRTKFLFFIQASSEDLFEIKLMIL